MVGWEESWHDYMEEHCCDGLDDIDRLQADLDKELILKANKYADGWMERATEQAMMKRKERIEG